MGAVGGYLMSTSLAKGLIINLFPDAILKF